MVNKGGIITPKGGLYRLLLIYSTSFDFNEVSNEVENDYIRLINQIKRFLYKEGCLYNSFI